MEITTYSKALDQLSNRSKKEQAETTKETETFFTSYVANLPRYEKNQLVPKFVGESNEFFSIFQKKVSGKKYEIPFDQLENLDENVIKASETRAENVIQVVKSNIDKFTYRLSQQLIEKYYLKCWNGQIYHYLLKEGRFRNISQSELKTLIRTGWSEDIQILLTRNVMLEIIERLQTEPCIQVNDDYFNCFANMMNVENGVLNLGTNRIHEHSPDFRFTHLVHAKYLDEQSSGHEFTRFIKTCTEGNVDKERHLQEVVGYLLSEFYAAKKVPFFIGVPNSGKSMLLRVITQLVGPEHVSHVPLHRLKERFVMAHLSNKKLNISSELNDEALSSLEVFKSITGNDELVAEFKGKDHFTYKSRIKLVFAGNEMPSLRKIEKTSAFFDRLTFIQFNNSVPEKERDHHLDEKLVKEEGAYILSWALKGIKRLAKNNFVFSECEESRAFKAKYVLEQNHVADFVKSYCTLDKNCKIHSKTLFDSYLRYCKENCLISYSRDRFFAEISNKEVEKRKFRINGSQPLWGYVGVTLKGTIT